MKRILLLLLLALALFAGFEWVTFPDVAALAATPPATTAFMELRKRELRSEGKDDTLEYQWVSYSAISPSLRRAVLVAEDDAFYEHKGVDVEGLKEAARKDWEKKSLASGGSTITQQLAKNLYLSPSRNPFRKLKELLLARSLERHLTKKRILELYLNVAEFGERTYGAEAAARHYFGKAAASLSPSQAALLAGCLPNPRIMDPAAPNSRLRWRQRMILSRMKRWGYLFEKQVLAEKRPAAQEPALPPVPEPASSETASSEPVAPEPAGTDVSAPADTSGTQTQSAAPETAATETAVPPAGPAVAPP